MKLKNKGFTLVELLVVMIIIGLGLAMVTPKLADISIKGGKTKTFFDDIIEKNLRSAKELNRQVCLRGVKNSENLYEENTILKIPEGLVMSAIINGENSTDSQYLICFYPDGIFDQFTLTTQNKKIITSIPLAKTVRIQ